jgi:hypothetical protein
MKTLLLPLIGSFIFCSCVANKQIQAEIIYVQLVKIDTVNRYRVEAKQLLTWRDDKQVDYITYEPIYNTYKLGARMKMMVRR